MTKSKSQENIDKTITESKSTKEQNESVADKAAKKGNEFRDQVIFDSEIRGHRARPRDIRIERSKK